MWRSSSTSTSTGQCDGLVTRIDTLSSQSSFHVMASPLKVLLAFLRILRSAKDHTIKPFSRWWASLLAYLGRKLSEWRCSRPSRPGTFGKPKQIDPSSPGGGASSYLVSGGSACLSGYAVAASAVPTSANQLERAEWQPSTAPSSPSGSLVRLPVDQSRAPSPNPTFQLDANRSTGNLSTQSRASDRLSIITNSRESIRASVRNGQPSRAPRATHRQFGRGPTPSQSREQLSLSGKPSSINLPNTIHPPPHLEIVTTIGPTHAHADEKAISPQSPAVAPSSSSHTHESLSPPANREKRRGSSTSVIFNIQNPSVESLSITSSINPQKLTEEPMSMDTATQTSLNISPADRHEIASLRSESPTPSSATSDFFIHEGRFVQMIHSEQVPRYTKDITMQVDCTIGFVPRLHVSADPARKGSTLWNA